MKIYCNLKPSSGHGVDVARRDFIKKLKLVEEILKIGFEYISKALCVHPINSSWSCEIDDAENLSKL